MTLGRYFQKLRKGIVRIHQTIATPYGKKSLVYTDWIASGLTI